MNITLLGIFIEGILSFLSPCVLPLVPLYMSYIVGNNNTFNKKKTFFMTVFFVLGLSVTFCLLAISINLFKDYLNTYANYISLIGGVLLIIFALNQLNILKISFLNKEFKFKYELDRNNITYLNAFLLGFSFSLGWTPCIGPMLANAIFLSATNANGYLYIISYALGLIIPFLLSGLLTNMVLEFINAKKHIMKFVSIITGVIMLLFGIYMIYNASGDIFNKQIIKEEIKEEEQAQENIDILEYEFVDIDNNAIKLSDYKGKYLFLNFTASWCTYCIKEMPDYEQFSKDNDIYCLYIMSPLNEKNPGDLENFIENNNSSITTLIDEKALLFYYCQIESFPTTVIVSPDGKFLTYYKGALDYDGFNSVFEYAKNLNE